MGDGIQNIFIIGAQCTGKTTLVSALAGQFAANLEIAQPAIINEVAREVWKKGEYMREDVFNSPARTLQLQHDILIAQHAAEHKLAKDTSLQWYISDRSGIDPIVYASLLVSENSAQDMLASEEWKVLERHMTSGLVILCEPHPDWLTDDGTRLMPQTDDEWQRVDEAFQTLLNARGIPYVVLPRTLQGTDERVAFVNRLNTQACYESVSFRDLSRDLIADAPLTVESHSTSGS